MAILVVVASSVLPQAQARTICTVYADAKTGAILSRQGDCDRRVTPASTFKIPLSLMGFDTGFLTDEHNPTLLFRTGYPDWGGAAWHEPTDPERWIAYSVVWYSQQLTHAIGAAKFQQYTDAFAFGNADLTGDPGKQNGLDRAWLGSSLHVSAVEQVVFLTKLLNYRLPVGTKAVDTTKRIVPSIALPNGWDIHGKTGTAFPRDADGHADEEHGFGWYVGWAIKGEQTIVFANLLQDDRRETQSAGLRARDALLQTFPPPSIASSH